MKALLVSLILIVKLFGGNASKHYPVMLLQGRKTDLSGTPDGSVKIK
jgi:hypothetical protein